HLAAIACRETLSALHGIARHLPGRGEAIRAELVLRRQEHALERRVRPVGAHSDAVIAPKRRDRERFRAGEFERELVVERARLFGTPVREDRVDSVCERRVAGPWTKVDAFVADRERCDAADAARVGNAEHEARRGKVNASRVADAEVLRYQNAST